MQPNLQHTDSQQYSSYLIVSEDDGAVLQAGQVVLLGQAASLGRGPFCLLTGTGAGAAGVAAGLRQLLLWLRCRGLRRRGSFWCRHILLQRITGFSRRDRPAQWGQGSEGTIQHRPNPMYAWLYVCVLQQSPLESPVTGRKGVQAWPCTASSKTATNMPPRVAHEQMLLPGHWRLAACRWRATAPVEAITLPSESQEARKLSF